MLLGDVTQAAAAFVAVQGAFNWLIDNFSRASPNACRRPTGWATCSWPSIASRRPRDRPPVPMSSASRAWRHERWPLRGPLAEAQTAEPPRLWNYPAELSITNSTSFAIFSRVRSPEFEM
jgi:hypothetical protein